MNKEKVILHTNTILDSVTLALSQFTENKSLESLTQIFQKLLFDVLDVTKSSGGIVVQFKQSDGKTSFFPLAASKQEWRRSLENFFKKEDTPDPIAEFRPVIKKIMETKQAQFISGEKNLLGMPLIKKGELIGIFALSREKEEYTIEIMQLLVAILQASALLIENFENEQVRLTAQWQLSNSLKEQKVLNQQLQEAKDQALTATHAKSAFLANMSHEIRTPLNGIMGMTELLLHTDLNDKQRRYADVIYSSSEHLLNLINRILDLSKIEAGEIKLEAIKIDVSSIASDVAMLLAPKAKEKGIDLIFYCNPDLPEEFIGDPLRIRQILTNLVGNAIKFTDRGRVKISVDFKPLKGKSASLRFEIRDTGIGMPEEVQKNLFRRFMQADSSMTRKFGGTGLGLAISKKLVEMMGGKIGVESREGEGTQFWFELCLPVVKVGKKEDALEGVPVYIVAGKPENGEVLQKYLRSWGMQESGFSSLEKALEALQKAKSPPRFLLLDEPESGFLAKIGPWLPAGTAIIKLQEDSLKQDDKGINIIKPASPGRIKNTLLEELKK